MLSRVNPRNVAELLLEDLAGEYRSTGKTYEERKLKDIIKGKTRRILFTL